jgi:hypothetical protein
MWKLAATSLMKFHLLWRAGIGLKRGSAKAGAAITCLESKQFFCHIAYQILLGIA